MDSKNPKNRAKLLFDGEGQDEKSSPVSLEKRFNRNTGGKIKPTASFLTEKDDSETFDGISVPSGERSEQNDPEEEFLSAEKYALSLAALSYHTEKNLTDKLSAKNFSESAVEYAVSKMKEHGYVNDSKTAQNIIDKLAARLWGKKKICRYLFQKGICLSDIKRLDFSGVDFKFYCEKLSNKYPAEKAQTMIRALVSAGYSTDEIDYVLKKRHIEVPFN